MSVALLALATLVAVQSPGATKALLMTVQVEASAKEAPGVAEWTSELRTALAARRHEFRLAKPGEQAELVVRIDSVGSGQDGTSRLNGALVLGEVKRSFTYSFTRVRAEAEKLARNLRTLAEQMKAAGK
jgi:hypothetical protein